MKLPRLAAMMATGKSDVNANQNEGNPIGAEVCVPFSEDMMGIMRNMTGSRKAVINSLRRVNALRSLRINAVSTEEKPSLPRKPVFGVYAPREIVMAGGS